MQIFPVPGFLAKPSLGLLTQLPQSAASLTGAILVRCQIGQVFPNNTVDRGIMLCGVASHGSQNILIHRQSNVLHAHSICETVWNGNPEEWNS